ncbi:MAG: hypothetical protein NTW14_10510 [bacterium]|nr:hypothetical protein [bacterium]
MTQLCLNNFAERQKYRPENYHFDFPQKPGEKNEDFSYELRKLKKTPLFQVEGEDIIYKTKKPILVKASLEDDLYIVENESLLIYGVGDTLEEALRDFSYHVIYFHKYYNNLKVSQLTGDGFRLKKIYETLFIEG